jgi:hypothetical protein
MPTRNLAFASWALSSSQLLSPSLVDGPDHVHTFTAYAFSVYMETNDERVLRFPPSLTELQTLKIVYGTFSGSPSIPSDASNLKVKVRFRVRSVTQIGTGDVSSSINVYLASVQDTSLGYSPGNLIRSRNFPVSVSGEPAEVDAELNVSGPVSLTPAALNGTTYLSVQAVNSGSDSEAVALEIDSLSVYATFDLTNELKLSVPR